MQELKESVLAGTFEQIVEVKKLEKKVVEGLMEITKQQRD